MEAEDLKINDRVYPLRRTLEHGDFPSTHSYAWRQALAAVSDPREAHLYVAAIEFDTPNGIPVVLCATKPISTTPGVSHTLEADWFHDVDLVPWLPRTDADVSK